MTENLNKSLDIADKSLKEIQKIAEVHSFKNEGTGTIKWVISETGGKLNINKEILLEKPHTALFKKIDEDTKITISESEDKKIAPSSAPSILNIFGIKINIDAKIDFYKEGLRKNYVLSKSHNLLVANFAKMKAGFFSGVLSFLGVSSGEIEEIKKSAKESEIVQKKQLFEENEYTSELFSIIGGTKKQIKRQKMITDEIRAQTIRQFENWGLKEYFSKEKMLEIQLAQCQKILEKFDDEKSLIQYQISMVEAGISLDGSTQKDLEAKLSKIDSFIAKAKRRIEIHNKFLESIKNKETISPSPLGRGVRGEGLA